jgi:hypothetical protein
VVIAYLIWAPVRRTKRTSPALRVLGMRASTRIGPNEVIDAPA